MQEQGVYRGGPVQRILLFDTRGMSVSEAAEELAETAEFGTGGEYPPADV